jgi:hypothetical protein
VDGVDQCFDSAYVSKALRVAVLVGIGSEVFQARLPVWRAFPVVRDAGTARIDRLLALIADEPSTNSHPEQLDRLSRRRGEGPRRRR